MNMNFHAEGHVFDASSDEPKKRRNDSLWLEVDGIKLNQTQNDTLSSTGRAVCGSIGSTSGATCTGSISVEGGGRSVEGRGTSVEGRGTWVEGRS